MHHERLSFGRPAAGRAKEESRRSLAALTALAVLWLLHNDFWLWDAPHRLPWLAGLPAGFAYHVGYCLAAAGLMAAIARFAWPGGLDAEDGGAATHPARSASGPGAPTGRAGPGSGAGPVSGEAAP